MAAELGSTSDPKALIPGDAGAVHKTQLAMADYGDLLHGAGEGLTRVDTDAGWHGTAGDAFRAKFHGKPAQWTEAGQCFHSAAGALVVYAEKLTWAQGQAAEAIEVWNQGEAATATAKTQHDAAVKKAQDEAAAHPLSPTSPSPPVPPVIPFVDPGEAKREHARQILGHARTELKTAGDAAERTVDAARDKAPKEPGFWESLGDDIGDVASSVGNTLANVGADVVNALASLGQAIVDNPASLAEMLGGAGLMTLGAGGEVLGVALDATGIGAVIGVPAGVVSAGAIAAGAGMAGHGAMQMSKDASENPVEAVHGPSGSSSGGYSGSGPGYEGYGDSIAEHIAGRRTLNGVPPGSEGKYIQDLLDNPGPQVRERVLSEVTGEKIILDEATGNVVIVQPMATEGGTAISKPSLEAARKYFEEFTR
jgi:hypothetical protein